MSLDLAFENSSQSQEERIDYEEVFAPVARIEAIRLFLAYASFLGFMVYQKYIESAFLYGTIKEEVYVCQPLRFEDPDHPDKIQLYLSKGRKVRFGNDHVAAISGFGDLQWGNILITRVYFVEGLGHNFFSIGQFCDSDLEEMASTSPICLMARASSTKSWLWHQRLSHLNFDTIKDLTKNDLVVGLPKFKYHKEHLCPSCEQGKSKRASHPPKPVPNSRQRLHLLHMDLCGPMRIASINGKRYILVIVDDYSSYTGALCYPKNDRKDIGKLGAKGDIGFFIGYSADSCAYKIYNHQTKKIMETMNVLFDELSAMAFEQRSSKPGLQSELDVLFEAMYDDYFGGQPSATVENVSSAQEPQVRQTSTASTTIADNIPIPTNSSSHATNIPITLQDVDELNPNAMVDGNTFVNHFATSSSNAAETSSSSQNVDPSNMHMFYQPYPYEFQWTNTTCFDKKPT
nr:Gag-Pol polyprotein [Tanacetum cinerariifolium]